MNFSRGNNQTGNKRGILTALIFLFVNALVAQTSYPITDPRNPNCPCHKYQKLADDEFKNLLAQNNVLKKEKSTFVKTTADATGISDDDQGKTNKQFNENNKEDHEGISSDDLARISVFESDNVLGKINEDPGELKVSEQKMDRTGSSSFGSKNKTTKHWKGKRKKHSSRYKQLKRIFYVGGWDIWKRKRTTSACFHWK